MLRFDEPAEDHEAVKSWLTGFQKEIADLDYETARARFDDQVVTFSTFKDVVQGLDEFENAQWRKVWHTSSGFHWDLDTLRTMVSGDRLMVVAVVMCNSTGYHQDGTTFERPARGTVVLVRDRVGDPWRGAHAHLSFKRGVPQQSFGNRTKG